MDEKQLAKQYPCVDTYFKERKDKLAKIRSLVPNSPERNELVCQYLNTYFGPAVKASFDPAVDKEVKLEYLYRRRLLNAKIYSNLCHKDYSQVTEVPSNES